MPSDRRRSRYTVQGPYEKRGRYHIVFYDTQGKKQPARKWVGLGTSDETEAHAEWKALRDSFWLGEYDPWEEARPKQGVTAVQAAQEYLEHKGKTLRDSSLYQVRRVVEPFVSHYGEQAPIAGVTSDDVQAFFASRNGNDGGAPAAATLRSYHSKLKSFFRWADGQGYRDGDPTEGVPVPSREGQTFTTFDVGELDDILQATIGWMEADSRVHKLWLLDLIQLMACTGMRKGEVLALRWDDVERLDDPDDMATIGLRAYTEHEVERGADAWQPKNRGGKRQLQVWPRGTYVLRRMAARHGRQKGKLALRYDPAAHDGAPPPVTEKPAAQSFRRVAKDAGVRQWSDEDGYIRRARPHDLRHTFISWMMNHYAHQIGVPSIADQVGHEDLSVTEAYRESDPSAMRGAMLRTRGREPSDGKRPGHEKVAAWLNGEPTYPAQEVETV